MKNLDRFNTKMLRAERLQQEHFEFIHKMNRNEQIMAHLGGLRSLQQTSEYMKKNLAHWEQYGYGIWILRQRTTEILIGRGGLRNNVLATEFVEAVVRIGFTEIGLSTLVCTTQLDNISSKRVLEKSNFRHESDIIYLDRPHLLYRRDKG